MTPGARAAAAVEVLADIAEMRRPASEALKAWGLAHRFAGSGDRAAIAALVFDALRRRASAAALMSDDSPRGVLVGALSLARGLAPDTIAALFDGARHAPPPLTDAERGALDRGLPADLPPHVAGDYPLWLDGSLARAFGERRVEEAGGLAQRAPVDLRVNALKASREDIAAVLAPFGVEPTPLSPLGLRIAARPDGRAPALQADPTFLRGEIEVQDEGSQIATLLAKPPAGGQVLDLCAGAGGKTLALAAAMGNGGQVYATDRDPRRLAPIHARLERAGVRNVQVRTPRGREPAPLDDLAGRMDLVLVDAPCTGTGTWRRNPDAKWRVRPGSLQARVAEQDAVLRDAVRFVKPGGRLAYVTCSVLPEENDDRIAALLDAVDGFERSQPANVAEDAGLGRLGDATSADGRGLQLTPARHGTDGFFVSVLRKTRT